MVSESRFQGKVAFVTGGASGIGKATALAFAREGAHVAVIDNQGDEAAAVARQVESLGRRAIHVSCDVSKDSEVRRAVAATVEAFGRLDCAFNNAGIEGKQGPTADCTEENWDRVIAVNLKGAWLCMRHQIPQMLKQGGGAIVNCSSIAGLVGFQGVPAYVASKHGLIGLTKTAALEYVKAKIRVNAVCPGVIQTPMIERFTQGNAEAQRQLAAMEPIGRVGTPDEIASAALWLCSSGASFVTGHSLVVDGGWVAQ